MFSSILSFAWSFISGNWIKILLFGGVAIAVILGIWHYNSLVSERDNLKVEVELRDRALEIASESLYKQKMMNAFSQKNAQEFVDTAKNVDNNTTLVKEQIESIVVVEQKERVLDEKSSTVIVF